jgi:cation diffusion facilitator family transporter
MMIAPQSYSPRVRRVLSVILALNLLVVVVKVVVGIRTGALTVLGSALESSLDLLKNVLGMIVVAVAARAPDEEHPYGHEKFESLATLAIVMFLSISCFELLREATLKLLNRVEPAHPGTTDLALMIATAAVNAFMVWFEQRRGRELGSMFLLADAAHTSSDLYVTILAIASLALARSGLGAFDAPIAILVAILIARNGYVILKGSVPVLVDQRAVDAAEIRRMVYEIPHVVDVRNVRSRAAPSGVLFAEITIAVSGGATVAEAHAIADAVEERITSSLGTAQVTVHVEPA